MDDGFFPGFLLGGISGALLLGILVTLTAYPVDKEDFTCTVKAVPTEVGKRVKCDQYTRNPK